MTELSHPVEPADDRARYLGLGFAVVGFLAIALGLALGEVGRPFPALLAAALFLLTAVTRRFGVALPGKWFVSFVPAAVACGSVALGWGAGGVVGCAGFVAGDLVFRRVRLSGTVESAGHLACGIALGGFLYRALGGTWGLSAFAGAGLIRLVLFCLTVSIVANAIVFIEMRTAGTIGRVNPRLTLRWETAAAGLGMLLGISALRLLLDQLPLGLGLGLSIMWLFFAGMSYFMLRRGASAEGYLAVEALTRAIGARTSLGDAVNDVRGLTGTLVPWHHMAIARYDQPADEFVTVVETDTVGRAGQRFRRDGGLARVAIERGGPVTDRDVPADRRVARLGRGSEILVPLYMGGQLVGLWNVRHAVGGTYWKSDAELLGRLAIPLALAMTLDSLMAPVLDASSGTAEEVASISAAAQRLRAGSERSAANARRTADDVREVARTLTAGAQAAQMNRDAAESNAASGAATRASGQEMLTSAREVRATTMTAADRLRQAASVVQEGAEQIERLREVSDLVDRFRRAIEDVAYESGMLALNAAIEASRAGDAGRGFNVVAREVRALAERSVREAQGAGQNVAEIQLRLGKAGEILERIKAEVGGAAALGASLFERIDAIHNSAEQVAMLGEQIAASGRETAERSITLAAALEEGRRQAEHAATESDNVAMASAEQSTAIEHLNETADSLRNMALDLAARVAQARAHR
jgi:methyl-accepting chemotaxis protein